MKFSTVIGVTTLSVLAMAYPTTHRRNNGIAGAAYFLTNEPTGNFIISSDIGQDGKLTLRVATKAGGLGAHGVTSPLGPDALFSQGSVKVSGNNLFAVNSGSNTVSMFAIDPQDPAKLQMIGQPVGSGGDFPVSLTVSKKTGQVCVLNGGRLNGVSCFKQDQKLGLQEIDNTQRSLNVNQTTPANGPAGSVSHVIFSEDDTKLIASVKGVPPNPGFLATWDVDQETGQLSENFAKSVPGKGGLLPFGMSVIPGKNAVLVTDPGSGFDVFNFNAKVNGQQDTANSQVFPVSGQKAVCWTSFSQQTGNFYLTDIGTSIITEVNVDNNLNAKIVKQYPQTNGSSTIDTEVATINKKDFLYVLAPGTQSVLTLSLNSPGNAQLIQQVQFADAAKKAGITTSANNLQGMTAFVGL